MSKGSTQAAYDAGEVEARWQARWAAEGRGRVDLDGAARPFFNLVEFPYPSGEGLHTGHVFSYGGADTYGRYMRRRGHDVFQPIGYDAFGIHSENYALKIGAHPHDLTPRSVARFREQLRRLGAAFDWSREVNTTDPGYYRWTQWIFVKLFKAGLAYRAEASVNWCPSCKTVLANEQVADGRCERCDTPMTQRTMTQWFLRITAYADRLLDFSQVDFAPAVIKRQQAWIGRSEGAEIEFSVLSSRQEAEDDAGTGAPGAGGKTTQTYTISVFSTQPHTLPGATFIAIAPEHALAAEIITAGGPQAEAVQAYCEQARGRLELERQQAEPTGVFSGAYAIHPQSGQRLPIWVADYVLAGYGTGAIMGVAAHDARDRRFAERYGLALEPAQAPAPGAPIPARPVVRYRLRDWLISRQRYWGPPIPFVYCARCGTVPVPEDQLPVLLPPLEQFRPTGSGRAPLATAEEWLHTSCPGCGGPAEREADVSDNFLDSAWYFLRYTSTERADVAWDSERVRRWLPVGMYTGGPEHTTMHHLYARFISMALHDLGLTPVAEPFGRLRLHGTITKDGSKMSKSRGNVVNPDDYIARYGVDATRMALLFLGPFDESADFSDRGVAGMARFLGRVWAIARDQGAAARDQKCDDGPHTLIPDPQALIVRRVTDDLEERRFHTAIAALMEYANWLRGARRQLDAAAFDGARRTLVLLLAPFAPHISEELWARLGGSGSVHDQPWPEPAATQAAEQAIELPVQVDGRLRDHVRVAAAADEAATRAAALECPRVRLALAGRSVARVVVVPGRLVNVVTERG